MSDLYEDDGWEATVTTPRMGGGKPLAELYVVAIKDRDEAQAKIAALIGDGARIREMIPVKANIMQGHRLFPGKWTTVPVIQ